MTLGLRLRWITILDGLLPELLTQRESKLAEGVEREAGVHPALTTGARPRPRWGDFPLRQEGLTPEH